MHSNGIISAPLNTDDVKLTLGENSNDVGTLCMSKKINPCAKYKPVRGGDQSTTLRDSVTKLWRAPDQNCGFAPYVVSKMADIPTAYTNANRLNGWIYLQPIADGFKRLTDFDGYDHNARMATANCAANAMTDETAFPVILTGPQNDRWIRFEDIKSIGDGYLGVYAVASSQTPFYVTSQKKISEGSSSGSGGETAIGVHTVPINWKDKAATWTLYPIFCTKPHAQGATDPAGQVIYTVPYISPLTVAVAKSTSARYVTGSITQVDGSTLILNLSAVNTSINAINFGTVHWQLRMKKDENTSSDRKGTWEVGSVAAHGSASTEITLRNCQVFINQSYAWLRVYSSNTAAGIGSANIQVHFMQVNPNG